MTVFNVIEKRQKSRFLPSGFLQKSSFENLKSTFTVKLSPCSSLEVTFFVLTRFPGRATAFCFCASWPCLDFQHLGPKETTFRSGHFPSSTSKKPNSQTKYITLLASLRKWTLSYRHAQWCSSGEICPEIHAMAKMAKIQMRLQRGPFESEILATMAYLAINRQNRQIVNKTSNEMAKRPFWEWHFWRKWRGWRKWQNWRLIAKL